MKWHLPPTSSLTWHARDRLEEQHPPQPPALGVGAVWIIKGHGVKGAAHELDARVGQLLAEGLGLEVGWADGLLCCALRERESFEGTGKRGKRGKA